ncbi:male-specific lethal 3 homolog isoform X2 [Papilio machaon]|uniref:male-specific lethal 3 homolog isoform X2 n=1 Tax=Papilio machaon TaxID=76193 RepID=UPI001E6650D8|nr:male-specific lethal 3 homolog isoform X2 [Papilio machaon]
MVSTRGLRYKFSEGERVLCYEPDPTKAKVLYDSKVLEVIESKDKRGRRTVEYLIHFQGWNSSWDRCVSEDFVLKDTQENRQLQRDLAEKSQLQLGAYLYRRERKKRVNTTAHPGPAKRARHGRSDAGSSTSTQPDEVEPGDTDSSSGSATSSDSGSTSSSSGSQQHLQRKPQGFKADIPIPPALRDRLTFDYHLVVKRGRLARLPASPCAAEILESYVKWFAHTGVWQTTRTRHAPAQRPDILDVSCRLHLVREVAEGIRIYIDFILGDHLLYKQEQTQYWQICGQYNQDKPKSESEDSQEEDTAATDEEMNSTKMAEYSHLPPDPVRNQNNKENNRENDDETEENEAENDEEDDEDNEEDYDEDNEEDKEVENVHNNVENHSQESATEEDEEDEMENDAEHDESDDARDNAENDEDETLHNNVENEVDNGMHNNVDNEEDDDSNEENDGDNVLHNNVENVDHNAVNNNIENEKDDAEDSNEENERDDALNNDAENEEGGAAHNNVENGDGNIAHNNAVNGENNAENDEDDENSEEENEEDNVQHNNAENEGVAVQNDAGNRGNDVNRQNEVQQNNEHDAQNEEEDDEEMDVDNAAENDEDNGGEKAGEYDGENDQVNDEDEDSKSKVMESVADRNLYKYTNSSSDPKNECEGEDVKVDVKCVKIEASSEEAEQCDDVTPRGRRCATRSGHYTRRLRSYKSNKSHSENEEQAPSTSTEQKPFDTQSSSVESTMSSLSEEWRGRATRAPPPAPPTLKRTPLSLLLEKVSKWRVIPRDESTKHLPCRIYGATHLARLFVKLPEFLNATNMAESKLKIILKNIDMFIQYLDQHGEWFGEMHYMSDGRSDSH